MRQIKIKNFGPIKTGFKGENGFMDITKTTLFIGNQGAGKSSVAKLLSTLTWLEKALIREDFKESEVTKDQSFRNKHCAYQGIHNYFKDDTTIEYRGKAYNFIYKKNRFEIERLPQNGYLVPKIMYIPAERNFVSAVDKPSTLKNLPRPLYTFLDEFENARRELKESVELPIGNAKFGHNNKNNISSVEGHDFRVRLSEASSGFQSFVPMFLVTRYLALSINKAFDPTKKSISVEEERRIKQAVEQLLARPNVTEELRKTLLDMLSSRVRNYCFINIVEEPEQNLYPTSQRQILNKLLEFSNLNEGNELIITTHSPYIINYLTLAIKAHSVFQKMRLAGKAEDLKNRLETVVPLLSHVAAENATVYELNEFGVISKLETYKGLPSDENLLNQLLSEGNELFDELIQIEELCQ